MIDWLANVRRSISLDGKLAVEFRSLRLFHVLAQTGSFAETARREHTVQSNVTAHIKKLEDELNTQLFLRKGGVRLTPSGRLLLAHADNILAAHADAVAAFQDDTMPSGRLRIGSMETTAAVRLGPVIAQYHERYPKVGMELKTGPTAELCEDVRAGRLDCALVSAPTAQGALESTPVFKEELVLVSRQPIADVFDSAVLADKPFVAFRQGCHYRHQIELFLEARAIHHVSIFEFGSIEAILGCVRADMGLALLPRSLMRGRAESNALHITPVEPEIAAVETFLVTLAGRGNTQAVECFLDLLMEHGAIHDHEPDGRRRNQRAASAAVTA